MRSPTEKAALAHLRQSWKLLPVMIQPIETSTGTGVPDVYMWFNVPISGVGWWLELKAGTRMVTPAQRKWLDHAHRVRLPAAVLRCWAGHTFSLDDGEIRYNTGGLYEALTTTLRHSP